MSDHILKWKSDEYKLIQRCMLKMSSDLCQVDLHTPGNDATVVVAFLSLSLSGPWVLRSLGPCVPVPGPWVLKVHYS